MKRCRVCLSPYREIYDELRLKQNKTIKEIWIIATTKYNDPIGYYSFVRHFEHLEKEKDSLIQYSKVRDQIVKESIEKDIEAAKRIRANLQICAERIEKYAKQESLTREEEKSLLEFIHESTLLIEQLLKWGEKLNIQPAPTDIFQRILDCMKDFPPELIDKFAERWNKYESNR